MMIRHPESLSSAALAAVSDILYASFPSDELGPIRQLFDSCNSGSRRLLIDDASKPSVVAITMAVAESTRYLEYLAVHPRRRNRGLGSNAIAALKAEGSLSGYVFEIEKPGAGTSTDANRNRQRRLRFYLRNGAMRLGAVDGLEVPSHLGGVPSKLVMCPMWLPISASYPPTADGLTQIYKSILVESYGATPDEAGAAICRFANEPVCD